MQNGVFNWNSTDQGLILGCYFYGYIISNIPGAWLAKRIGFKWVLGFAMLASSVITLCSPVAAYASFELFVALRILLGFFQVSDLTLQFLYKSPHNSTDFLEIKICFSNFCRWNSVLLLALKQAVKKDYLCCFYY